MRHSALRQLTPRPQGLSFRWPQALRLAEELLGDFQDAVVLRELKSFRCYNDGRPLSKLRSVRLSLRRLVAKAKKRSVS